MMMTKKKRKKKKKKELPSAISDRICRATVGAQEKHGQEKRKKSNRERERVGGGGGGRSLDAHTTKKNTSRAWKKPSSPSPKDCALIAIPSNDIAPAPIAPPIDGARRLCRWRSFFFGGGGGFRFRSLLQRTVKKGNTHKNHREQIERSQPRRAGGWGGGGPCRR